LCVKSLCVKRRTPVSTMLEEGNMAISNVQAIWYLLVDPKW
jgi:hypothetical protein